MSESKHPAKLDVLVSRRSLLRGVAGLAAIAGAGASLAACGGGSSATAKPSTGANGGTAPSPTGGGAPSTANTSGGSANLAMTKVAKYPKPESYTFSNIVGPLPQKTPASEWIVDVAKQWHDLTGDTVNLRYTAVAQYEASALATEFASGAGPDLYMISAGDFARYYNNGAMLDLTPYLTKAALADYVPGILTSRTVDGKVYGLPEEAQPVCVFYSKKAWEKAHLTEADIPKTWDQLKEVAHKLTTKNQFGLLIETVPSVYQNFTWYPFMWMGGGDVVKNNKSIFESDATIAALKLWQDLVKSGVSPRKALGNQSGDTSANLGAGYCAMEISGVWSVADMEQNAKGFDYGIFPLPTPPGGKYLTIIGGWAWCVNPKSPNASRAAQFATFGLSSNTPYGVKNVQNVDTVDNSNLPTLRSVENIVTQTGPYASGVRKKFITDIATSARSEPRYPAGVWQAVSDAIQAAQMKGEDPGTAAAAASKKIDTFLKTYKGCPLV